MAEIQAYKHSFQKKEWYAGTIRLEVKDIIKVSDEMMQRTLDTHMKSLREQLETLILQDQVQYRVGAK